MAVNAHVFVAFLLFLSTAIAQGGTIFPFRLRAWNDYRFPPPGPIFNHYVELDLTTGDVIVNATQGWQGFNSYLDPMPEGFLRKQDDNAWGYLFPLYPVSHSCGSHPPKRFIGHFALRYGPGIPKIANVLYTNFTATGRGCGAHCGGPALDYDEGEGTRGYGTWYVFPRDDGKDGVWLLRWTNVEQGVVVPPRGVEVILWRN
ncbi:hypothetical protein BDZ91DRAFT_797878 [Kalaharituber pfeilii]|nr:hypothetical protein BDZ91DRAFT_797878 [Kalaharituber pfeilii]